ncbi:hypothetical protein GW932_04780 [archaeon]|nr:hypothetical protein [archaeon]
MKSKIEKIVKGYKLAKIDMKAFEYNKKPFVTEHPKLCGGKEEIYSPLVKFGGVLAYLRHPIKGYKIISYNPNN